MSAPSPATQDSDLWQLINRIRDRCYDISTPNEKKRLNDIILLVKPNGRFRPMTCNGLFARMTT
jgi:hypothetical protein